MATSTERINQIMKEKKLRQIDVLNLAKPFQQKYNIKFSKSHLSQYVNGKSNPDNEKIFLLSKVFGVTEAWLLGYNVPRYERIENTGPQTPQGLKIPVLGTVAAGIPISAVEEILDYEEVPQSWKNQGEFFGLRISMKPDINHGDTVIVRKQSTANNGDVVITLVNGDDVTCKKFEKLDNGIILISNNSEYSPMYFSNEEVVTKPVVILGRVVELRRKF
ncbi:putative repressor LexA [Gemella haemolysans]|uniref:Putative repressor LexA n=1 Tax=Gemella haemolysans TaxID=1379 RepID=A0A133ZTJ9_9BACL|nr:S24 family peptidase [Gemella haemolysans]KXB58777.1 putative repressor LexA [Gemella haemolysans]